MGLVSMRGGTRRIRRRGMGCILLLMGSGMRGFGVMESRSGEEMGGMRKEMSYWYRVL
jgi:hypothetical protein